MELGQYIWNIYNIQYVYNTFIILIKTINVMIIVEIAENDHIYYGKFVFNHKRNFKC